MLILFYKLQRFRWIKKACLRSHDPGTSKSDLKAKFSDIKTLPLYSIALLLLKSNGFVKSCFVKVINLSKTNNNNFNYFQSYTCLGKVYS